MLTSMILDLGNHILRLFFGWSFPGFLFSDGFLIKLLGWLSYKNYCIMLAGCFLNTIQAAQLL